jgi:hypothetical protein
MNAVLKPAVFNDYKVADMSLAAWVKCAPFASPAQASVVEWGAPGLATSAAKLSLSVQGPAAPTVVPGPFAGVCDNKWHHMAVTKGDGAVATPYTALQGGGTLPGVAAAPVLEKTFKQYLDGALVATLLESAPPPPGVPGGQGRRARPDGGAPGG